MHAIIAMVWAFALIHHLPTVDYGVGGKMKVQTMAIFKYRGWAVQPIPPRLRGSEIPPEVLHLGGEPPNGFHLIPPRICDGGMGQHHEGAARVTAPGARPATTAVTWAPESSSSQLR